MTTLEEQKKYKELLCLHCGGSLILSPDRMYGICPYCDSSFLLTPDELQHLKETAGLPPLKYNYLDIIKDFCTAHKPYDELQLHVGRSLKHTLTYKKAKKALSFPNTDDAFLICDCTSLLTVKRGFALCTSGLYYAAGNKKKGMFTWNEYKNLSIYSNESYDLYLNDIHLDLLYEAFELLSLLLAIQKNI